MFTRLLLPFAPVRSRSCILRSLSTGRTPKTIPGVKNVIPVASGKGGVGKSTTAVNLAIAVSRLTDCRVGILDADIYGPSLPLLMNLEGKPHVSEDGTKQLIPLENYGVKCMSMGFIAPQDQAIVWRGPMVMAALQQLLFQVQWGSLEYLFVDMPPGTGDAQLTLAQSVELAGSVIVSTPQDLALLDARRGIKMFHQVGVDILGIVENMSYFECPKCNTISNIFGEHGARETAETLGVPFLGGIPLHPDIRTRSDEGQPIVVSDPESAPAKQYQLIAEKLLTRLTALQRSAPSIVVE